MSYRFFGSFLLIACCISASAQSRKLYLYMEVGGGIGTHSELKMGLNTIIKGKHIISGSLSYYWHDARNRPDDFVPLKSTLSDGVPNTELTMFSLLYGRVTYTKTPLVRYCLRAGPTIGKAVHPEHFRQHDPNVYLYGPGSYLYEFETTTAAGLLISPTVEFPLGEEIGLSAGAYANINSFTAIFGINATLMFCRLRD